MILEVHRLWYIMSRTVFAKALDQMTRGLKASPPLIVFINISNFFKWKIIYIMKCSIAH